jgi:glycosyltransferase involved in cell wall biosynthesis
LKVIFIGNLIPRKGLDTLLKALARLRHENWTLTVAGDPEVDQRYSQAMQQLCQELGLTAQVDFLGYHSNLAIPALLEKGHLLAVPSQYEGFGIVYLEAMGFGLPPLASAAGGARDLIRHGENGYLVRPGDIDGLAALLQKLQADKELLVRLSLSARRTYESHPTWPQSAAVVHSFLENLHPNSP